jgi:serine/threonine protein kinase
MHTHVGQLIGTLQYMSPEQFAAEPDELDVRADVYAMGVVLYELLAGRPPYNVAHKGVFEVAHVVRDVDPAPLSSVNKTLRRDLATIVHKCLEKDRGRRYSSAAELAADLGRYLVGDPITRDCEVPAGEAVCGLGRNLGGAHTGDQFGQSVERFDPLAKTAKKQLSKLRLDHGEELMRFVKEALRDLPEKADGGVAVEASSSVLIEACDAART